MHTYIGNKNTNFFICYMAAPQPALWHCQGDSFTHHILTGVFLPDTNFINYIIQQLLFTQ